MAFFDYNYLFKQLDGALQDVLPEPPLRVSHQLLRRPYPSFHAAHCLVGLCATCICEHTQQHLKRGSPPHYENIKNTFARYNERMREQIDRVEQDKEWLVRVG